MIVLTALGRGRRMRGDGSMISNSTFRMIAAAALAVLGVGAVVARPATAGDVTMIQGRLPSVPELAALLWPDQTQPAPRRSRSLKWSQDNLALAPNPDRAAPSSEPSGFAFLIQFAFDSTEILPESRPYLDLVGDLLMSDQAKGRSINVIGHADASGPANYNQKLSRARADAVRSYLMAWYGVPRERLEVAGRGEEQPLPGIDPNDPANRRVEFVAVHAGDAMM
jgi:outer membrane protein OmpA-like peptidoglycan-associated protein